MNSEGASSFSQPSIPIFDGDYKHWSLLMENLLRSKEYCGVIEVEIPQASETLPEAKKKGFEVEIPQGFETLTAAQKKVVEDLRLKDLKAKNYLFASIDKSILKTITNKSTAKPKHVWDSMKLKYQGNGRVQRGQLN
ncbi:unnamed protein product [Rhodiola kirilowii]